MKKKNERENQGFSLFRTSSWGWGWVFSYKKFTTIKSSRCLFWRFPRLRLLLSLARRGASFMVAIKTVAWLVNRASPLSMDVFHGCCWPWPGAALSQPQEGSGEAGKERGRGKVAWFFCICHQIANNFHSFYGICICLALVWLPACQTAYFAYVGNPGVDNASPVCSACPLFMAFVSG